MILKSVIRSIICFIGIILLNATTYGITYFAEGTHGGVYTSLFIRNVLFGFYINEIPFSPLICFIGFIAFLIYEYYFIYKNNYFFDDKINSNDFHKLLISDIKAILFGIFIFTIFIGLILILSFFIWLIYIIIKIVLVLLFVAPYRFGWNILLNFDDGCIYILDKMQYHNLLQNEHSLWMLFSSINIVLFIYVLHNFINNIFLKSGYYITPPEVLLIEFIKKIKILKGFLFLYLLYLIPSIIVFLYPTFIFWLDFTNKSFGAFISLSYLFLALLSLLIILYFIMFRIKRYMTSAELKKSSND